MKNIRYYGSAPYHVAVIHGGPGAAGEVAPVARRLSSGRGVLEPLQTAASLEGQVEELRAVLDANGALPVTLIGFSWGAWLSFIFAAMYPERVKKLILIGSGPLEEKYADGIQDVRLDRLSSRERIEIRSLMKALAHSVAEKRDAAFARLGALFSKADACDPMEHDPDDLVCSLDIFQGVWKDAAEMRRSGALLKLADLIRCPVVAIHGDHDPHPAEGVSRPLISRIEEFRFVLLRNCGHKPWIERKAKAEFYHTLEEELEDSVIDSEG